MVWFFGEGFRWGVCACFFSKRVWVLHCLAFASSSISTSTDLKMASDLKIACALELCFLEVDGKRVENPYGTGHALLVLRRLVAWFA